MNTHEIPLKQWVAEEALRQNVGWWSVYERLLGRRGHARKERMLKPVLRRVNRRVIFVRV